MRAVFFFNIQYTATKWQRNMHNYEVINFINMGGKQKQRCVGTKKKKKKEARARFETIAEAREIRGEKSEVLADVVYNARRTLRSARMQQCGNRAVNAHT